MKEFQEKLDALLKEYNVTLQPVLGINIVPLEKAPEVTEDIVPETTVEEVTS